jgi:hypothetical protein
MKDETASQIITPPITELTAEGTIIARPIKRPEQHTQPPIPDSNGNGVLDYQDILAQLKREEEAGSMRTPNEKAHGILEVLGARELSENLKEATVMGVSAGQSPASLEQQFSSVANAELTQRLDDLANSQNIRDPKIMKEAHENIATNDQLTPELKAVAHADIENARRFAETFKETFPKGIKLEGSEGLEVLGHFGGRVVFPKSEEKKKDDGISI